MARLGTILGAHLAVLDATKTKKASTVDDEPSVASLLRLAVSPLPVTYLHACRYGNVPNRPLP